MTLSHLSSESPQNDDTVSEQDFLALVSGIAPPRAAQQIWTESLSDGELRHRLALSLPPEDEEAEIVHAVASRPSELSDRLQRRRETLLSKFGNGSDKIDAENSGREERVSRRVLRILETLLTLPCLAPALAASEPNQWTGMQTQTLVTDEAVRVEFQQLSQRNENEKGNPTLRIIVDASELDDKLRYTRAFVTVAKETGSRVSLSIPLNARAVGYLDTVLLSPSATAHRIVGVTLQEG